MKQLYKYQQDALNKALLYDRYLLALDMGLGKTFTALKWLEKIKQTNNYNTIILVDSKKVLDWKDESENVGLENIEAFLSTKDNVKFLDFNQERNKIYILSYARFRSILKQNKNFNIEYFFNLIVDESQVLKDSKSQLTKILLSKTNLINKLLLLSGDPISTGYHNLYSQMKLLNIFENEFKYSDFQYHFCKIFTIPKKYIPIITGYKNVDKLLDLLKSRAHFLKTEEAVDLPQKRAHQRIVKINKHYLNFKKDRALIEEKWSASGNTTIKYFHNLRQLASGVIKTESGEYKKVDDAKFDELKDLIESSTFNFSLFYNYKAELHFIKKLLEELKIKYFEINGQKNELKDALNYDGRFIILIQYASGSRGIDGLQNKIFNQIYFSLTYSGEMYKQSLKRIHRLGQENKVNYYFLLAENSIEKNILDCLKNSQDYTQEIFKKEFNIQDNQETEEKGDYEWN